MKKDYSKMSIEQLENEKKLNAEKISYQKTRYYGSDYNEHRSAERRLGNLYAERQNILTILKKKERKANRPYKIDQKVKSITGYTRSEIKEKTEDYYGTSPAKLASGIAKHMVIIGGIAVTLYGSMWGLYQLHVNGIDSGQDFINKITATEQQDTNAFSFNENDHQKLSKFFNTVEGKRIEKYSLIYGVDSSLAASVYIHGNPIRLGTYITTFNEQTKQYEDIIVGRDDSETQTKAICAKLAEISQLCNGNPAVMTAMYDKDYDEQISMINKGVSISDYKTSLNDDSVNTEFVQTVLNDCPTILTNSWYENGHKYTKTVNINTSIEQTKDEIIDVLTAYKAR